MTVALAITVPPTQLQGVRQGIAAAHCELCGARSGESCAAFGGFHIIRVASAFRDATATGESVIAVLATLVMFTSVTAVNDLGVIP